MKNTIKYTAAMLLVSAGFNAYAAGPKITTSGEVKTDISSSKSGDADWSGHNVTAEKAQVSLNIATEKFSIVVTLDAAQWYNKALTRDGDNVTHRAEDLDRLLDEAYVQFKSAGGDVTLGKQHIVLMPKLEKSSLEDPEEKEQVLAIRFTTEGKAMLAGIGIDVSLYETESYDNKIGDDFAINVILSKDLGENLKAYLALKNEKDSDDERANRITVRGVYTISPELNVSAQYQHADEKSNVKFGAEYKLASDITLGASHAIIETDGEEDSNRSRIYGTKNLNPDSDVSVYFGKETQDNEDDQSSVGLIFNYRF